MPLHSYRGFKRSRNKYEETRQFPGLYPSVQTWLLRSENGILVSYRKQEIPQQQFRNDPNISVKQRLHLRTVTRGSSLCRVCSLTSAHLPGRLHGGDERDNPHSSHGIHLNLPNATAVGRSHHRSPWQQSPWGSVDPPRSGTAQQTPGTADYSSQRSTAGSRLTHGTSWVVVGLMTEFLTYPSTGDYLKSVHVLHYKSRSKEENKDRNPKFCLRFWHSDQMTLDTDLQKKGPHLYLVQQEQTSGSDLPGGSHQLSYMKMEWTNNTRERKVWFQEETWAVFESTGFKDPMSVNLPILGCVSQWCSSFPDGVSNCRSPARLLVCLLQKEDTGPWSPISSRWGRQGVQEPSQLLITSGLRLQLKWWP